MENFSETETTTRAFSCNTSDNLQPDRYITFIYMVYLMTIVGILTVVGNTAIIFIYILYRDVRKSPSNMYILNLAVADICVGIFVMLYYPFFYFVGLQNVTVAKVITIAIIHHWFVNMSVFIVIFMCIDRYEMVSDILRYRKVQTRGRVFRIVIIGWITCLVYSVVINLMRYFTEDKITTDDRESCKPSIWESYGKYTGWVTVVSFFIAFCIPLSLMVFFNGAVFKKLRLHSTWQDTIDPVDDEYGNKGKLDILSNQSNQTSAQFRTETGKGRTSDREGTTPTKLAVEDFNKNNKGIKQGNENPTLDLSDEMSSNESITNTIQQPRVKFDETAGNDILSSIKSISYDVSIGKSQADRVPGGSFSSEMGKKSVIAMQESCDRHVSTTSYPRRSSGVAFERRKRETKKLRKAALCLILFVMVYVICWLPFYLVSIATSFSDFSLNLVQAEQLTYMILLSNSCINPLIYPFMNIRFRKGVFRLMKCQCNSRKRRRSQHSRASEISHLYMLD